jgi:iron(III) transport system ATP-binding protein
MLALDQVRMDYALGDRAVPALRGVDLEVAAGEFFTLLGPSGCGKTTALRSIAGLETPTGGRISIGGEAVFDAATGLNLPPNRRDISMVFQSYAIWPHMTVGANVAFPLETMPLSRAERATRVREALELVGLGGYAERPAPLLSGGQQQRVALARALVKNAKILLLDEPLSNLDAKLREQMRDELRSLQRRVGTTTVYVTHDQDEALAMSDRIALMRAGEIVETGTPEQLYLRPRKRFTAEFLGRTVILTGTPVDGGLRTAVGIVKADGGAGLAGGAKNVMFRPEHIRLSAEAPQGDNTFAGVVTERRFAGRLVDYTVTVNGVALPVQTTSATMLPDGQAVAVSIPRERCVLLDE